MTKPVETVAAESSIEEMVMFFTAPDGPHRHKSYPVIDAAGSLLGMVARADVLRWTREGWSAGQTLGDVVVESECVTGYEDELVGHLADRMAEADAGRVPITRRADGVVVGLVARRDLLRIRATTVRHERDREVLIRIGKRRVSAAEKQLIKSASIP
jgi:chloride channel protein, CIC family